ncbi:Queuosine salvage protein [Abeliophyllum distichum]|uniref:Queuosine 5'-phosphate N-glycosylase/hydrolase n=1 Tax=Abeliophyllum distichum TaxID=126358 RepID=A0ABD1V393_9LAMI
MEEVRSTSAWVASHASHVIVDSSGIEKVAGSMKDAIPKVEWDFEGIHYFDNGPLTVQYLFVLDALNFCFWPDKDLSYDHLASGLKEALQNDKSAFDADKLQMYSGPELRKMLKWKRPLPLEDERVRLIHEVGLVLERSFEGKASKLVESCENSAAKLIALITSHFPGFRDHTVYKGHQVFLYKRAQIFAADLWGAFKGQGYGEFNDIGSITMFADYIVPAVLQQLGVLRYSSSLSNIIKSNSEIGSGSEEEVELRACSVHAVEEIRELIYRKSGKQVLSVELDLWLWSVGIQYPALQHHRKKKEMSCNGCRVLRKGCSDNCILRPCLQWIENPEAQGHATIFLAKFFGRAGLMSFISAVPENQGPAVFRSLLFEAAGRTVNPVNGAVGLLWTGNWQVCQEAVETVLCGGALRPLPEFIGSDSVADDAWNCYDMYKLQDPDLKSGSKVLKRHHLPDEPAKITQLADLDISLMPCFHSKKNSPLPEKRRHGSPMDSEESVTTVCGDQQAIEPKLLNLFK